MAEMTSTGIGLGDAMGLMNRNNDQWGNMWNNPFMYLIWLAMFGNGGFGGWGNNNNAAAGYSLGQQTAELQNAIYASNDQQSVESSISHLGTQVNAIGDGIASATYALNNSLKDNAFSLQNAMNAGFTSVTGGMNTGFNAVTTGLMENKFAGQQGVTALQASMSAINNNIDALKYEGAKNTCAITTAIREDGEATRALINANTMQALRDKLAETNQALQSANFQISQQAQNEYLVGKLGGCGCTGCNC